MATAPIEVMPTQTPREQWLAERRKFIGGSEAYELLNQAQYGRGCRTALAMRKLGAEPDFPEQTENDPMLERGKMLEPLAAMLYEEQTGRKVRRPPVGLGGFPKPKRHPEYSWAGVNTDRIILVGSGGVTETGDLEIKTRGEGPWHRVQRQGPFPGDELQPQWSLFVTGHSWAALATLGVFGGLPMSHFDRLRNNDLIETFKREGESFANDVWGKGVAPAPAFDHTDKRCKVCEFRLSCRGEQVDAAEVAEMKQIAKSKKNLVQIDNPQLLKTLADRELMKEERKALDEAIEVTDALAMEQLGNVEGALVRGFGKVYRMESQANYVDAQRLKAEKPDIYKDYFVSRKTGEHHLRTYPEKLA